MGSGASTTAPSALHTAGVDDQVDLSLDDLCLWIRSQGAGPIGDALAVRCADSGLSVGELLFHLDQETLLSTLDITLNDSERKQVYALIQSSRKALCKEFRLTLKELPDAMDRAVYVLERFPLVVDPSGQATRFLKYQLGAFLMVGNPTDMAPETLRRHLVGALKHGTWLVVDFDTLNTLELEQFFAPDSFPREIFSRHALFKPQVYAKLLREGDPDPNEFIVNDQFKFVVICRSEQPPPKTALSMCVLHVLGSTSQVNEQEVETCAGDNDPLAKALGVCKVVKRNSLEMVEAAFENDLETVIKCLDQNYDVESADGHGHTALSEAACQGHLEMVKCLLEKGADPNKLSDQRRSAMYRAAYNGHAETVQHLLQSGGDPRIVTKQSETAFDVAKTPQVQDLIQKWDVSKTEKLLETRRQIIEKQWEERITNHVERERYARKKIHEELIELVRIGDAERLMTRFNQLIDDATESGDKPRASADVRDDNGSTLLAIAVQFDHLEVATMLTVKWKEWKALALRSASQANAQAQRELAKKQEMMAITLKANVNARDCRGWTPVAIAVFHESKKCLKLLLENGADPKLKNQYNKNAYDFAKDDIDAALNIVKSRAEIREVLLDWENQRRGMASENPGTQDASAAAVSAKDPIASKCDGDKKLTKKKPAPAASTKAPSPRKKASSATKAKSTKT